MEINSLMFGFVLGILVAAVWTRVMVWWARKESIELNSSTVQKVIGAFVVVFLVGSMLLGGALPALAQTPVPVPTLDIPTAELFTQTNFWMDTFAPVVAIGVGITIALAILGYVGMMIAQAFKNR